jgi:hypothetical protein
MKKKGAAAPFFIAAGAGTADPMNAQQPLTRVAQPAKLTRNLGQQEDGERHKQART